MSSAEPLPAAPERTGTADERHPITRLWETPGSGPVTVRRFQLTVVEGPQAGQAWESSGDRCSVGAHSSNDLVVADPTVSRFHCEVRIDAEGARICDLASRNGTIMDGARVKEAFLRGGSLLQLGSVKLRFDLGTGDNQLPLSDRAQFGAMVGSSVAIRTTFAVLERAAATDATVLLEGETGTGKGAAAESLHRASPRRAGPFVVVDCGAIPGNLLESEMFGHERGAFTGAESRRIGAFEDASGGTIFLDEIGELPFDMQAKLLRVLENREIRRLGSNGYAPIDVRVVAATNRDLRAEVNAGRFRPDLYFRLAVVKIPIPPLRERPDDIRDLADKFLGALGASPEMITTLLTPPFIRDLQCGSWPGNVRELRNYLERCLVFQAPLPLGDDGPRPSSAATAGIDASLPYAEARARALAGFERGYLKALLVQHQGKVAQAALAAGVDRVYLYRLLRRHRLKSDGSDG